MGEEEPIPTLPAEVTVSKDVPDEEAIVISALDCPEVPCRVQVDIGLDVPMPTNPP